MSRRTRKNIGIIGLGIIGSGVADVLREKAFRVFVWNRTPKPVPNFVGAPIELAEMCDVLQIFVSDDDALLDVVRQLAPGLGARHVVIAHPTVAPHTMISANEMVRRRGAHFVEAPFTGSKEAAASGQLLYYVGGDEAAIAEARPILQASSRDIVFISSEIGHATVIKITTNMVTAASVQAAAEAMALVRANGLSIGKFADAMKGNASNSKTLELKLPKMMNGEFDPHFSIKHMLKDMQIASRLGLSHHLELGVTSAARDRLLEQMQRGFGDDDYSAVARKYFMGLPSGPTESDLELFAPPPAATEQSPWVSWTTGEHPPEPAQVAPALEEPAVHVDLAQTVAPPNELEPAPAEEPAHANVVAEEEVEERRGFFGRLLRRES